MKTKWDYTDLAKAYLKRPDYSDVAIDTLLRNAGIEAGAGVCDVGAGVGHLTIKLAERDLKVIAVEPNDAMREHGKPRTAQWDSVSWYEGTGEETGQTDTTFELVTFGSSFNVVDREATLKEVQRILRPRGFFACMWNHRDLNDPIQAEIESIIKNHVEEYQYGTRREDQTSVIDASELFEPVVRIEATTYISQSVKDCVEAWQSHATLQRQAGEKFIAVVDDIAAFVSEGGRSELQIPYTTRIWTAQLK